MSFLRCKNNPLTRNSTQHPVKITANYSEGLTGCTARKGRPEDVNTCCYPAIVASKLSPLSLSGQCLLTLWEPASEFAHVCVSRADNTLAAPGVSEGDIACGWILSSDRISPSGQW